MLRLTLGVALAALVAPHPIIPGEMRPQASAADVRSVFAAVRGMPAVACAYAARGAAGWGDWGMTPPVSPLGDATTRIRDLGRGRMSDEQATLLVDSLSTADPCVRELALRLLGHARGEQVEGRLVTRLTSDAPIATREAVAAALGYVGSHAGVDPLLRAARATETGLRANAAWALGRIGDGRAASGVRRLLGDGEPLVREAAAGAVGALEDQDSADELLRVARTDKVARVRRVAAWALGAMEAKGAAAGVAEALRAEPDGDVREMLAWALGAMEARAGAPALLDALRRDTDAEVREMAAWGLGAMEAPEAADALGSAAGSDRSAGVRGTAAWALGQLELRTAPAGLLRAIGDADAEVRRKAAWSAAEIRDPRATTAVRDAFRAERDADARKAQLRALARLADKSDPIFKELLRHEDAAVREMAVRALAGRGMDPWPWPMPRPRPFP